MKRHCLYLLILTGFLLSCNTGHEKVTYTETRSLMGSAFVITALADEESEAREAVHAAFQEIDRIEKLISSWNSGSETWAVNANAGNKPVKVSEELYQLIKRSQKVSRLTNGVFDITFAGMDEIWKFDGTMDTLPDEASIRQSIQTVNYKAIIMDPLTRSVYLPRESMKIGFGAIGKGYAANKAMDLMVAMGIEDGVVNAGGDLITWGRQEDGKPWTIGIADPAMKESALSWLEISDLSVVTSGDYERYFDYDGKRYSHIIDPRTGWPAELLTSVTIICPDAELGDALATAVFILGTEDGIELIDMISDVEAFIIDQAGDFHHTENIDLNFYAR